MEVHPAYAVVLDEEGHFLKAANLRYQVGDTVRDIVELRRPKEKRPALWKPLSGVAGLAACLCIVFFGYYQPNFTPYGALRIQINRMWSSPSAAPIGCWSWRDSTRTARS